MKQVKKNRRAFIKSMLTSAAGVGLIGTSQLAIHAKTFANSINDYKALVGIFLYGGNDSFNMLIPMEGESLSGYQQIRTHLAQSNPLAISPATPVTDGIGLMQALAPLHGLFEQGKLAIQARVGTLIEPIIEGAMTPSGLLSHSNQQETWQRGAEVNQGQIGGTGWAGRVLDRLSLSHNQEFLSNISLQGRNLWQSGNQYNPYSISTEGVDSLEAFTKYGLESKRAPIMRQYFSQSQYNHKIMEHFRLAFNRTETSAETLNTALENLPTSEADSLFPEGNELATQLKQVLNLIRIGQEQQVGRQVFLVGMGGFDTHRYQYNQHISLLEKLSSAMSAFYNATEYLGINNDVTSFTMSDFGRSRTPNSSGTDHGWAGHQFILGGSVKGDLYGDLPTWSLGSDGDNDTIPTTANEQMFASLAKWFGLSESECFEVFPNLSNFGSSLSVDYFNN